MTIIEINSGCTKMFGICSLKKVGAIEGGAETTP